MQGIKLYLTTFLLIVGMISNAQQVELSVQTGHTSSIKSLCYSPNGKLLASSDVKNKVILWDMETGGQMLSFIVNSDGKEDLITTTSFNSNSKYFIIGTKTGDVFVYDIAKSKEINRCSFSQPISQFAYSDNADNVLLVAGNLFEYNIITNNILKRSDKQISNILRARDGSYNIITGEGEYFKLSPSGELVKQEFTFVKQKQFAKKIIQRDELNKKLDAKLALETRPKRIKNIQSRKNMSSFYFYRTSVSKAVFSQSENEVYFANTFSRIKAINIEKKKELFARASSYIDEFYTALAINNKFKFLIAANTDSKIYILDPESGKSIKTLKDHLSNVNDVLVSPDENYFASASNDRSIIIWSSETLLPIRRLCSRAFAITSMDISNDGNKLVFADEIGYIKTIDLSSVLLESKSIQPHNQPVPSISFTSNDSTFISAGNDNRIVLTDFNSAQVLAKSTFKRYFQLNMIVSNILELLGLYIPPKAQMDSIKYSDQGASVMVYGGRIKKGKFQYAGFTSSYKTNDLTKISSVKTGHENTKDYYSYNRDFSLKVSDHYKVDFYNKVNGHTDTITGIEEVKEKNLIITSSLDATLKIWDAKQNKLLLTLIPVDKNKLIKLTSDNYYMAPKTALTAIGFKYGLNFFPPEQFDIRYNRPDKIMAELNIASPLLLKAYEMAFYKRLKKLNMTLDMLGDDFHAPEINVSNVSSQKNTRDEKITFTVSASDSKYNLNRINVYNNDIPVFGTKGIDVSERKTGNYSGQIEVNLIPGKNKIQVSSLNEKGVESLNSTFEIFKTIEEKKPDLYIISIGVSNYTDSRFNLNYAAKDANDVALLFSQTKGHYGAVYTKTMIDEEVTKEKITALKEFLLKSKPNDVVIVFIAGHGMLDEQFNYYFGTSDIDFNNPSLKGIEYAEIENLLDGIPAMKKILFMDTCHSGEADKEDLELTSQTVTETGNIKFRNAGAGVRAKKAFGLYNTNEMMKEVFADVRKGTGSTVVSSAGATEFAFEGKSWSNGLFTYCLLKGLRDGDADINHDRKIVLSELQDYIRNNVMELSGGMQVPNSRIENISMDFRVW